MTEAVKVAGLFLAAIAAMAILILYQQWKHARWLREKIRRTYGAWPEREYDSDEFEAISHYFRLKQKKDRFYLDDITWNDLEMDQIFMLLNHTWSSVGESCLYALLRTPSFSKEEIGQRNMLTEYFMTHQEQREKLEFFFAGIGKSGRYSIFDFIYNLADQAPGKRWKELIWTVLILAAGASIFVRPEIGILALICCLGLSWSDYYRKKRKIDPYLMSCGCLLQMMKAAKKLEAMDLGPAAPYQERIREARKKLEGFKRNSFFVMTGDTGDLSGGIAKLVIDYLNFTFHVDLIQFSTMILEIRKNLNAFDEMVENMGMLECAAAIASFRKLMPEYCLPEFSDKTELDAENVYHPLIPDPVKNSISVSRGVLLTGSNASGKSTFLKTVAINAILAQTIDTCLADRFRLGFSRVYSSMALRDDLAGQDSYYIVEIKSLKRILDQMGKGGRILAFIDEVLRGTNTVERIAASSQILKSMNRPDLICFAATHDIELTHLLEADYENFHFQEEVKDDEILFDYRLYRGRAVSRNAIRLLHMMGYADSIIQAAEDSAKHFVETGSWT
ncbi:MAG: hypothetical protein SOZ59_00005 [Candidatus Limivivens sp.]|nr:hypothetical protein [Candidatus Limivivens sp.]